MKRLEAGGRVRDSFRVAKQRLVAICSVKVSRCIPIEGLKTGGRVVAARGIRISASAP